MAIGVWKAVLLISRASGYALTIFTSKIVAASSQKLADPPQHSTTQSSINCKVVTVVGTISTPPSTTLLALLYLDYDIFS